MSDFEQTLREGLATLAREAVPDAPAGSDDLAELQCEPTKRRRNVPRVLLIAAVVALIVGMVGFVATRKSGVQGSTKPTTTTTPTKLEPADAASPAAGACDPTTGAIVTVTVGSPDNVPMPRCVVVHDNQRVRVVNISAQAADVSLGEHFRALVPAHGEYTFSDAVGPYLAAGVHYLAFSPFSHAEIWVKP